MQSYVLAKCISTSRLRTLSVPLKKKQQHSASFTISLPHNDSDTYLDLDSTSRENFRTSLSLDTYLSVSFPYIYL